ncbi:DNA polymerase III subunit delta' [Glaciecola sp. KUL10]|uniref:DNA polymerase III subunit delta' n=1 Tax=Glaciecola sp. (strain KUL10) TaxID=2161813 RepID=UPI000D785442|nr:DNA polymerase III subunit delta' [Glaciecola sp. KUL10]
MSVLPWFKELNQQLASRINNNILHHAILISGTIGLGKEQYASHLSKKILCEDKVSMLACGICKSCQLIDAGSHPDNHVVVSDKTQIGIDLIRKEIETLSKTAQLSGNKVLTIANADLMTESATNSLLKTLEEPTNNTYIILTSSQSQRLLPTILSRCEKLNVNPPDFESAREWLSQESISPLPSKDALRAFKGSPLAYKNSVEQASGLLYTDFEFTIQELIERTTGVNKASIQWQKDADKLVVWLGQYFLNRYKDSNKESDFIAYQKTVDANKKLNHAGLNKVLILQSLFSHV